MAKRKAQPATNTTTEEPKPTFCDWTSSPNFGKAVDGIWSCICNKKNAWIDIVQNGEQSHPITKKNPALNDPFMWSCSYSTGAEELSKLAAETFFNPTERELTLNWVSCYVKDEATAERYRKTGALTAADLANAGVPVPVPRAKINEILGRSADDRRSTYRWSPRKYPTPEIPHHVLDESIGRVFVVRYDSAPFIAAHVLRRLAAFMDQHAETLV